MANIGLNLIMTEVTSFLGGQGVGTVGSNLFAWNMPSHNPNCVAVIPTGGPSLDSDLGSLVRQQFQVRIRNKASSNASSICTEVHRLLHRAKNVLSTVEGSMTADHEPGVHFPDQNGHYVYTLNITGVFLKTIT